MRRNGKLPSLLWPACLAASLFAAIPAIAAPAAQQQAEQSEATALDPSGDYLAIKGARIWYASIGKGKPVVLLHGGLTSSRSWDAQVPALLASGHRVILIDSRGHGRSTMGPLPLRYDLLAEDVLAVLDHLHLARPAVIGWSDGAIVALLVAMRAPQRLGAVYAFGANMDKASVRPNAGDAPILATVAPRLVADYAARSPDPSGFGRLQQAVRAMQASQDDIGPEQLRRIRTRVTIAGSAQDEFILPTHFRALAKAIPSAQLALFPAAGHFLPWQNPALFNRALLTFLDGAGTARPRRAPLRR
ncbi:pimeloyl-ACP methyl ester carboxylesterase [Sphingomonas trueperi]|uniref:alpha/beta fold hydrolase n=1 Tax=Sphingomonas trueperi TaxID=53317 RepID=UPI0033937F7B